MIFICIYFIYFYLSSSTTFILHNAVLLFELVSRLSLVLIHCVVATAYHACEPRVASSE